MKERRFLCFEKTDDKIIIYWNEFPFDELLATLDPEENIQLKFFVGFVGKNEIAWFHDGQCSDELSEFRSQQKTFFLRVILRMRNIRPYEFKFVIGSVMFQNVFANDLKITITEPQSGSRFEPCLARLLKMNPDAPGVAEIIRMAEIGCVYTFDPAANGFKHAVFMDFGQFIKSHGEDLFGPDAFPDLPF